MSAPRASAEKSAAPSSGFRVSVSRGVAAMALALSGAPGLCANADDARIIHAEIASSALGRMLPIAVIKAPSGDRKDWPVLFLLHGRGRHHRSLLESGARAALLAAPFVIVLPQGEDGWYFDTPGRPTDRYGTYLEEVMAWAEKNLPITRAAAGRGIAGWSMGGYGAVRFAQTHPGGIGFVASVIGLLDFPREETLPDGQNYRVPTDRFTNDPSVWAGLNPIHAIDRLRGTVITLVLATHGFERTMNENFMAALGTRSILPRVHWLEGGHQFPLVEIAITTVLADAAEFFGAEARLP